MSLKRVPSNQSLPLVDQSTSYTKTPPLDNLYPAETMNTHSGGDPYSIPIHSPSTTPRKPDAPIDLITTTSNTDSHQTLSTDTTALEEELENEILLQFKRNRPQKLLLPLAIMPRRIVSPNHHLPPTIIIPIKPLPLSLILMFPSPSSALQTNLIYLFSSSNILSTLPPKTQCCSNQSAKTSTTCKIIVPSWLHSSLPKQTTTSTLRRWCSSLTIQSHLSHPLMPN